MPTMADMSETAGTADDAHGDGADDADGVETVPAADVETAASAEAVEDALADVVSADLSPAGDEARRALEAVIMVADQPIEAEILAQLVERSPQQVEDLLAGLAASYEEDGRGFQLVRVAGGWRFQSHEDLSHYVERFVLSGQSARLSAAALETLAIVAYKQPISRGQVSAIRGVNVDGVMRTLQQRGYIAEVGKDPGPGQSSMFGTTSLFLEKLGLNDVAELPSLGDFIPDADVVELLEQGLRVDSESETAGPGAGAAADGAGSSDDSTSSDAGPSDGEPVASADEDVIDVTDQDVISVDDLVDGIDRSVEG